MKTLHISLRKAGKGQSFVELAIVFMLLLSMLAGVVEFGNLLNQYINVIDGDREGARFASNTSPFLTPGSDDFNEAFYTGTDEVIEGTYDPVTGEQLSKSAIEPVKLDPATDDVVISVFAIDINGTVTRFPQGMDYGWNKYGNGQSQFTNSDVQGLVAGTKDLAPNTGMILVEIFYNYHTLLQMPFLPDPIPLHAYAVMPLTAAEATPTP